MAAFYNSTTSTCGVPVILFQRLLLLLLLLLLIVLVESSSSSSARLGNGNEAQNLQEAAEEQQRRDDARQIQAEQQGSAELLISDQFIVQVSSLVKRNNILTALQEWMPPEAKVMYKYKHAITGFAVTGLAEAALQAFVDSLNNPGDIVLIEPDYRVELYDDDVGYYEHEPNRQKEERKKQQQQQQEGAATWGLDRIDQKNLPLNGIFNAPRKNGNDLDGTGVDIYVIDTGVRDSHDEFGGRVTLLKDFTNDANGVDYNGHGTHVAGRYNKYVQLYACRRLQE
jgi:subtilisin family serine protease